ncbi:DUF1653 domain-containing protein [Cytobacillus horneckiae]|uniref:DUF1653 domain-containing protein n=1 Tax=Cytobacillus horneckiae TaxID=549687 RepID=UPI003D9AA1B1
MEVYRHYKGGIYNVIGMGKHSETQEEIVIYEDTDNRLWVRPLKMFFEEIEVNGQKVERFQHLGNFIRN